MSDLTDYLSRKRDSITMRNARVEAGDLGLSTLHATVTAEGLSGVRRIRIRDFQIIGDSGTDFAGFDLGPTSPEMQLGVLGSCLTHVFLIQAAVRNTPLDSVEVTVSCELDPRAGLAAFGETPITPQRINYVVHLRSPAPDAELEELYSEASRLCPVLNLLTHPQDISGHMEIDK